MLIYEDLPVPSIRANEVLIRNEAAGINFADTERRRGRYYPVATPLPYVLGGEFSGVVVAVGDEVSGVHVGDRVFGITHPARSGCYAQYVAAPAGEVFPLPSGLGFAEATALLVQGLTAYLMLRDGVRLMKNDSVLVLAAAGGVGSLVVQLARIMGAGQVVGAASTPEKRQLVLDLGADSVVDYSQPRWHTEVLRTTGDRGVDAVMLSGGGEMFTEATASLAPFGRLAVYGTANGEMPIVDFTAGLAGQVLMNLSFTFFALQFYFQHARSELALAVDELTRLVQEDRLRLVLGQQLPLSAAAEAHRLLEGRRSTGKMVLLPWAD
ncbi:quinone oxidoreductase family protein [Lentzea flava]|uniref:Quinone oxidoreductase n=1 Tax=Lentzea flava TaxID=103732 RepID=A0ABQ2ULL2_9PSEU|nr:zinc-binding dehydrogenase [Lentzea flava]GGU43813.1 quinone oxidoreductase [Lentzea flava]